MKRADRLTRDSAAYYDNRRHVYPFAASAPYPGDFGAALVGTGDSSLTLPARDGRVVTAFRRVKDLTRFLRRVKGTRETALHAVEPGGFGGQGEEPGQQHKEDYHVGANTEEAQGQPVRGGNSKAAPLLLAPMGEIAGG